MSCDTERKNANEADKNAIEAKNDHQLGEKELKKLNLEIVEKTRRISELRATPGNETEIAQLEREIASIKSSKEPVIKRVEYLKSATDQADKNKKEARDALQKCEKKEDPNDEDPSNPNGDSTPPDGRGGGSGWFRP